MTTDISKLKTLIDKMNDTKSQHEQYVKRYQHNMNTVRLHFYIADDRIQTSEVHFADQDAAFYGGR